MEAVKQTIDNIESSEPTTTFLEKAPSSTEIRQISPETHAALWSLINKSRMLNGWKSKTAAELNATVRVWFEIFEQYKIPVSAYNALYFRAFDLRQTRAMQGLDVPQFDATLLVSCWTGQNGLRAELEQKRIDERRYLPDTARSQCPRCHGIESVWAVETDSDGYQRARRCVH